MSTTQQNIESERDGTYGESWKWTSEMLKQLWPNMIPLVMSGYFHPWYMIFAKLMRLMKSPTHVDTWQDIIGYAHLVVNDIKPVKREPMPPGDPMGTLDGELTYKITAVEHS